MTGSEKVIDNIDEKEKRDPDPVEPIYDKVGFFINR